MRRRGIREREGLREGKGGAQVRKGGAQARQCLR